MQPYKIVSVDVLIIGSGVSGLRAAAAAAEIGVTVSVVSKGPSASPEIMGFNAPVHAEDSVCQYIDDMENSADGICDCELVRTMAQNIAGEIAYMESIGLNFDKTPQGDYDAIHTLGTKYPRLIHYRSGTGVKEMELLKKHCDALGVTFHIPVDVLDLLVEKGKVVGAFGWDTGNQTILVFRAKSVVLATGGCGAMQFSTTYPRTIVGDGYAMAFKAGARLIDMEFQQFEPCCFVYPPQIEGKVIATTLLRHGATLRNGLGEEFMGNYGLTRENAQKSTLSRAMVAEVAAGRGTPHDGIYYDLTMMGEKFLYEDHAIFTRPAVEANIDLTRQMPEMMPAAHTCLGGIEVNSDCSCVVEGLFACGEVIGGLHGANRIGGSAGAETVVFGGIAGKSAAAYAKEHAPEHAVSELTQGLEKKLEALLTKEKTQGSIQNVQLRLSKLLSAKVGIARSEAGLTEAMEEVAAFKKELAACHATSIKAAASLYHVENMLLIASVQIGASLLRKESRGVFYRDDYPVRDETWSKNIIAQLCAGEIEFIIASKNNQARSIAI